MIIITTISIIFLLIYGIISVSMLLGYLNDNFEPGSWILIWILITLIFAIMSSTGIFSSETQNAKNYVITKTEYNTIIEAQENYIVSNDISVYKSDKDDIIVYYKIYYDFWGRETRKELKFELKKGAI